MICFVSIDLCKGLRHIFYLIMVAHTILPSLSDHTYQVHIADKGGQYNNGVIHQLPIHIDIYSEKLEFNVMSLKFVDVILGYP